MLRGNMSQRRDIDDFEERVTSIINTILRGDLNEKVRYLREEDLGQRDNNARS